MKLGTVWTPEKIEETFAGTGVGRKTICQIIKDHGIDHKTAQQRLKEGGIKANDDDKIKELPFAKRHFVPDFCVRLKFQSSKYYMYSCLPRRSGRSYWGG
jgi:hypothetical protein